MENKTSNPRRHSTMPECFSRISMSCNLFTNLFSLGWLRPPLSLLFLILYFVVILEAEFGSGVTGVDLNLESPVLKVVVKQARRFRSVSSVSW